MEAIILLAIVFALGFWLGRISKRGRRANQTVLTETPDPAPNNLTLQARMDLVRPDESDPWQRRHPEFRITYHDDDGVVTEREIYIHSYGRRHGRMYYFCWDFLRDDERTFRGDRIMKAINLDTGREIKDIAAYLERS